MNEQIHALFLITSREAFHHQFETYFELQPQVRLQFDNDELLWDIRKAFLWEYCADQAPMTGDKLIHYHDALNVLKTALQNFIPSSNQASLLYLCHYTAKIHYQIGVQWMILGDDFGDGFDIGTWFLNHSTPGSPQQLFIDVIAGNTMTISQHAISSFEQASKSYQPFKIKTGSLLSEEDFYVVTQQLHKSFEAFDAYSPWARLISIECNHFLCLQEEEQSEDVSASLLTRAMGRIALYKENNKHLSRYMCPSSSAISDVAALLLSFTRPQHLHDVKRLSPKSITSSALTSKKRKASVIDNWTPLVSNRAQFNTSLVDNNWIVPSFLRPRQRIDLTIIHQGFLAYNKPLVVTKPTGTGKTAEFSALANGAWGIRVPTIIIVPTATLVEQTRNKLVEYKKHMDMNYDIDHIGMFCPTKKSVQVAPITIVTQVSYVCQAAKALKAFPTQVELQAYIASVPNAYLQKEVMFHPDFFTLLIVDEGHHIEGEKLFALITRPGCERPKILFSASTLPGEYPRIDLSCQHLITQTLSDAIISHELAPMQALTIDFSMYAQAKELTRSIRRRMLENMREGDIDEESRREIAALLCQNAGFSLTAISVLKQIMEATPTVRKAMVFTESIDHANSLAMLLSLLFKKTISAYHTQTTNKDAVLSDFSTNKSRIIVAVGALDEGFDDTDVTIILDFSIYKTRIRRMVQRLGRALRLREDGSGAILISIKLLPQDLQLIPRDEILSHQKQSYLGMDEEDVLDATTLQLTLPAPLSIPTSTGEALVTPQAASIVFPKTRKPVKLGFPPEEEKDDEEDISIAHSESKQSAYAPAHRFFSFATSSTAGAAREAAEAVQQYDGALEEEEFKALLNGIEW